MKPIWLSILMLSAVVVLFAAPVQAEPYLAVRAGAKCVTCHVNPTGGGKRTEYGNIYGQTALAAARLDVGLGTTQSTPKADTDGLWKGRISDYFAVGGDLRANFDYTSTPNQQDTNAFDLKKAQLYFDLQLIPNSLSVYVDERVAPGGASNREAYALFWSRDRSVYFKAGRLFLPYGLRLEDDTAFIRQVPGINFNSSDSGVEGGLEMGPWSASLAITNGAGGASETDKGKQYSLLASFVQPLWRAGASLNYNDNDAGNRQLQNVFAGLKTGNVSWLAELDYVVDDSLPGGRRKYWAGLLEANTEIRKGHNLKFGYEYYDPDADVDEDQRIRFNLVWEFVPFQFTQFRVGYRNNQGIPQNDLQNTDEIFVQWHAFF